MSPRPVSSILVLALALVGCADGGEKPAPVGDDTSAVDADVSDTDTGTDTDTDTDTGDTDTDTDTEPAPTDADGDGFGAAAEGGDDCDDTNPDVHPWADEICEDGLDTNCDGIDGRCGAWESGEMAYVADVAFWGEDAGDGAGSAVLLHDMNGDGLDDALILASFHDRYADDGSALYVAFAPFEEGGVPLEFVETRIDGDVTNTQFYQMAAGDADGDGVSDILLGSSSSGQVAYFAGSISSKVVVGEADWGMVARAWNLGLGMSVDIVDLDGDGAGELLVGATGAEDASGYDAGKVYVFPGTTRGAFSDEDVDAIASMSFTGRATGHLEGDAAGWLLDHADMDGDGLDDALVGFGNAAYKGGVHLVLAPVNQDVALDDADATWETASRYEMPDSVHAGDLNGDGLPELVLGAPEDRTSAEGAGAVFVFSGSAAGVHGFEEASTKLLGVGQFESAGTAVAHADFDADGTTDLAVGADDYDWSGSGSTQSVVYVLYDVQAGTASLKESAGALWCADSTDWLGGSIAVGESDGGHGADILVGADMLLYETREAGAAYLVYGL